MQRTFRVNDRITLNLRVDLNPNILNHVVFSNYNPTFGHSPQLGVGRPARAQCAAMLTTTAQFRF